MRRIELRCSNPHCGQLLAFEPHLKGTLQACGHCQQEMKLPEVIPLPYQPADDGRDDSIFSGANPPNRPAKKEVLRDETSYQARTQKKVKAGSGCLAAIAAAFSIFIIALGLMMVDIMSWNMIGLVISFAGVAGIGAFAYFGYFATEGDDDRHDRQRYKQRK